MMGEGGGVREGEREREVPVEIISIQLIPFGDDLHHLNIIDMVIRKIICRLKIDNSSFYAL